jgi:deoxycytidylate deaminase
MSCERSRPDCNVMWLFCECGHRVCSDCARKEIEKSIYEVYDGDTLKMEHCDGCQEQDDRELDKMLLKKALTLLHMTKSELQKHNHTDHSTSGGADGQRQ